MATTAPSPDLRLSIHSQDLDDIEALFRKAWDISGALRMLAELHALPGSLVDGRDFDTVQARIDAAFQFLPNLLQVVADGVDARAESGINTVHIIRGHAAPRFRIRVGADLGEVPASFLKFQDPHIDQDALRQAHAQGHLPECFELDDSQTSA